MLALALFDQIIYDDDFTVILYSVTGILNDCEECTFTILTNV